MEFEVSLCERHGVHLPVRARPVRVVLRVLLPLVAQHVPDPPRRRGHALVLENREVPVVQVAVGNIFIHLLGGVPRHHAQLLLGLRDLGLRPRAARGPRPADGRDRHARREQARRHGVVLARLPPERPEQLRHDPLVPVGVVLAHPREVAQVPDHPRQAVLGPVVYDGELVKVPQQDQRQLFAPVLPEVEQHADQRRHHERRLRLDERRQVVKVRRQGRLEGARVRVPVPALDGLEHPDERQVPRVVQVEVAPWRRRGRPAAGVVVRPGAHAERALDVRPHRPQHVLEAGRVGGVGALARRPLGQDDGRRRRGVLEGDGLDGLGGGRLPGQQPLEDLGPALDVVADALLVDALAADEDGRRPGRVAPSGGAYAHDLEDVVFLELLLEVPLHRYSQISYIAKNKPDKWTNLLSPRTSDIRFMYIRFLGLQVNNPIRFRKLVSIRQQTNSRRAELVLGRHDLHDLAEAPPFVLVQPRDQGPLPVPLGGRADVMRPPG